MTGVIVSKEGGGYKVAYSLQDKNTRYTSDDGDLSITFTDRDDHLNVRYSKVWGVEESDFKKYGDVWQHRVIVKCSEVRGCGSGVHARVWLIFHPADEGAFWDSDTVSL